MFRTMIIASANAQLARDLAAAIDPVSSQGLFLTPLTDGQSVTHYISSGIVSEAFAAPLPLTEWTWSQPEPEQPGAWVPTIISQGDPQAVVDRAAALDPPFAVTLEQVEALFSASDVSEQEPFVAMGRMGLTLHQTEQAL